MTVRLPAAAAAEFIGTFLLCFVGILAIHFAPSRPEAAVGLLAVALAHGIALSVAVTAAMPTSGGHINPAVTIGFLVTGKIKPISALVYVVAQLAGATAAALAVYVLLGADEESAAVVAKGTPKFDPSVFTPGMVLLAEIIATGLLVFAVWGSAADPRARNVGGFAVGLTVVADILAIGPISGGAMNPARVFGPALVAGGLWDQHWVYWVGPLVGGGIMAIFYHLVLWPRDAQRKIDPDSMQVPPSQRP
ncbi:MAG: aquaporin [Phycisphaerae bacterium]|nr:aquaporin [Phycisphaerae bacterium]MDW8261566.1 aquaporin [Phycisphaerales bacterium]